MTMVGINCDGLNSKWQSFDKIVHDLQPCAFFLQETKLPQNQQFKSNTQNYIIFRLEREKTKGGGLAIGVVKDLNPILIRNGDDATEVISVKVNVNKFEMRLVVGYGAQDNDRQAKIHEMSQLERKKLLWDFLEEEINEAEKMQQGIVIQIDANAHLGCDIIKDDPNPRNGNGIIMAEFLERNPAIIVVNGLKICKGTVTRTRETTRSIEKSAIDFFLVNERMLPHVRELVIDEDEKYILTNFAQKNKNKMIKKADHRPLILELNIEYKKLKPDKIEYFNFRNEECQKEYNSLTNTETKLVECLKSDLSLDSKAKVWHKILKNVFYKSFTKIKVKNSIKKSNTNNSKLIDERRNILRKLARHPNEDMSKRVSEIEDLLCETNFQVAASKMRAELIQAAEFDSTKGTKSTWGIYRKLRPKHKPVVPVGKKDNKGKIVTNQEELKALYLETFVWRLRERPTHPKMANLHQEKEKMFQTILKLCKLKPGKPWQMKDLELVLKSLKKDKCRDPHGLINEIFFTNVAGSSLKESLLILLNEIKINQEIPKFMKFAEITAIYKGKGSMNDLKNERGIFIVIIYMAILMKLLYNEKKEKI